MTGFFSKLFGGKSKAVESTSSATALVEEIMDGLVKKGQLDLEFTVKSEGEVNNEEITVELRGDDQELLVEKDGALLDAFQLLIKRVLQHQMPESRANVSFDCNGFREETNKALVELAERHRDKALEQGRSVYLRALAPKDRKIVHQFLASDERVRSRSVGEGLYKKIKIYPVKSNDRGADRDVENSPSI